MYIYIYFTLHYLLVIHREPDDSDNPNNPIYLYIYIYMARVDTCESEGGEDVSKWDSVHLSA